MANRLSAAVLVGSIAFFNQETAVSFHDARQVSQRGGVKRFKRSGRGQIGVLLKGYLLTLMRIEGRVLFFQSTKHCWSFEKKTELENHTNS